MVIMAMMAQQRLNVLHTAFHAAKLKGLHNFCLLNNITPALKALNLNY